MALDARILRERATHAERRLDDATELPPDSSVTLVAITTVLTSYPTAASAYFAMIPCEIAGAATEGASPAFNQISGASFTALNLGSAVPPQGTYVLCHGAGGRWTFRYDG